MTGMTTGTGQDGPAGAPSTAHEPPSAPPLSPPLGLFRTYLLFALTCIFYIFPWVYRTARDLRALGRSRMSAPGWYVLGGLVPLVGLVVLYRLAERARDLMLERGLVPAGTVRPGAVVAGVIAVNVSIVLTARVVGGSFGEALSVLCTILLVPLPLLGVQGALNRVKETLPADTAWRSPPWRYTRLQVAALVLFAIPVTLVLVQYGLETEHEISWRAAPPVRVGQQLPLPGGSAALAPGIEGWRLAEPESIAEDSVLDLLGGEIDTYAVVYSLQGRYSLDDLVEFRYDLMKESLEELEFREHRRLGAGGDSRPISFARYAGSDAAGGKSLVWVASVAFADHTIEVVAATGAPERREALLRDLVESLVLLEVPE